MALRSQNALINRIRPVPFFLRQFFEKTMSNSTASPGPIRRMKNYALRLLRIVKAIPLMFRLRKSSRLEFTSNWGGPFVEDWRRFLQPLHGLPDVKMLEVGTYEGRSAIWFLDNILTHESARLTCIDPFFRIQQELRFDHNVRISGHGKRLTKIKARSADVLSTLTDESFDAIYIDGDHHAPAVLFDIACCWRLLRPSGVMILDDNLWRPDLPPQDRPQLAINLFLELITDRAEILHHDYQVVLRKVRKQPPSGSGR